MTDIPSVHSLLLLLMASVSLCYPQLANTTYLITPNDSTPCPSTSAHTKCLTLEQYARDSSPSGNYNQTITLQFMPGIHPLSTNITVKNINSFTMCPLSPSSNVSVTCTKQAVFSFTSITNTLVIKKIFFSSCAIHMALINNAEVIESTLIHSHGPALKSYKTRGSLTLNSVAISNSSDSGLYAIASNLNFTGHSSFTSNIGKWGGAINAFKSKMTFSGTVKFSGNSANQIGGAVYMYQGSLTISGNTRFTNNTSPSGGAVSINDASRIQLSGNVEFTNNCAEFGGALLLQNVPLCKLGTNWDVAFIGNHASLIGGAILMYQSSLNIQSGKFTLVDNSAQVSGGALYSYGSTITVNSTVTFTNNTAREGGGCYLTGQSHLQLVDDANINFFKNKAIKKGGAIFVECEDRCTPSFSIITPCFFEPQKIRKYLNFSTNTAEDAGSVLYGGSVVNCTSDNKYTFYDISMIQGEEEKNSTIASEPFKVCHCDSDGLKCENDISVALYPGQKFTVSVVTVGQSNGVVPSSVQAWLEKPTNGELGQYQNSQETTTACTDLTYTIFSDDNHERLSLTVGGKCSVVAPVLNVNISLLDCPKGFELSDDPAKCVCQQSLQHYTKECTIDDHKIHRKTDFWVGYDNSTQGLILHPHCPFDYCVLPPNNFTIQNSDLQCNYNRTKLLCGQCRAGLSLALGTSTCLDCSNYYLALLFPFALAGLALVFLLFACRLTVAKGTLSGIIFYANIVHSNRTLFFPPGQTNILTVFVAWFNLDLGIQTCFYNGLDTYARTWLQFLFPTYVFMLCGLIVLASKKSRRLSRALGTNPVAVLATLFLLSYTKLLCTAIATLSFTTLSYPHNHTRLVWLYDANIAYLHGKHIPLFVVGLATLLLCLPYTLLLLTNQWLRAFSNYRFLHWVNSPRVKFFLDAYNAPFKTKHCYWTGLLLLARLILLAIFATNVTGNLSINLYVISITTALLATFQWVNKGAYKSCTLDIIEASLLLNLNILSTSTYFMQINQAAIAYTSAALLLAMFIAILFYHGYLQATNTSAWKALSAQTTRNQDQTEYSDEREEADSDEPRITPCHVTQSEITLPRSAGILHFSEVSEVSTSTGETDSIQSHLTQASDCSEHEHVPSQSSFANESNWNWNHFSLPHQSELREPLLYDERLQY